jgi:hypothetical protein
MNITQEQKVWLTGFFAWQVETETKRSAAIEDELPDDYDGSDIFFFEHSLRVLIKSELVFDLNVFTTHKSKTFLTLGLLHYLKYNSETLPAKAVAFFIHFYFQVHSGVDTNSCLNEDITILKAGIAMLKMNATYNLTLLTYANELINRKLGDSQ